MLSHAHIPGFTGGFVGVDVFFVISGFLITGLLLGAAAAGKVGFATFYSRRALRILPAATLVIVATAAASLLILNPLRGRRCCWTACGQPVRGQREVQPRRHRLLRRRRGVAPAAFLVVGRGGAVLPDLAGAARRDRRRPPGAAAPIGRDPTIVTPAPVPGCASR